MELSPPEVGRLLIGFPGFPGFPFSDRLFRHQVAQRRARCAQARHQVVGVGGCGDIETVASFDSPHDEGPAVVVGDIDELESLVADLDRRIDERLKAPRDDGSSYDLDGFAGSLLEGRSEGDGTIFGETGIGADFASMAAVGPACAKHLEDRGEPAGLFFVGFTGQEHSAEADCLGGASRRFCDHPLQFLGGELGMLFCGVFDCRSDEVPPWLEPGFGRQWGAAWSKPRVAKQEGEQ